MALPEYEKIAGLNRSLGQQAPANLPLIEESVATGEVAALYNHFRSHFGRPDVPGILKCFATHPPLLQHMMDLSEGLIFADGHLTRKHKEMIATLVSHQNACPYCFDSHAYFLRMHGGSPQALAAIQANDLHSPELTLAEQALLAFTAKVNRESHKIGPVDVEQLQQSGWSEAQIAEAIHVATLFATFNRVANAFGLGSQGLLTLFANEHADEPARQIAEERRTP
jgi:uncharacterized peroxidase-related enzyme